MASSKSIYDVLHDIQVALKVPKNLWNDFGKYPYRNAESILQAVKPLLPEGYAVLCDTEPVILGNHLICICKASLVCASGAITATGYSNEPDGKKGMDSSQVSGSNESYAKKYALGNLFAIDGMKDSDDPQVQEADSEQEPEVTVVDERKETLDRLWKSIADYAEQYNLVPKEVAEDALGERPLKEWPTDELANLAADFESQVV